jgi:hypothetical protein
MNSKGRKTRREEEGRERKGTYSITSTLPHSRCPDTNSYFSPACVGYEFAALLLTHRYSIIRV